MSRSKRTLAVAASFAAVAAASSVMAQDFTQKSNTPNVEYGEVLKIRVPNGLCEFEDAVPSFVVRKLSERNDWGRLVEYMLVNCPELGLPLADTVTASISTDQEVSGGDDDTSSGAVSASEDGSSATSGGDAGGEESGASGEDTSADDDGNNGHGNDEDRHDESNPGNG